MPVVAAVGGGIRSFAMAAAGAAGTVARTAGTVFVRGARWGAQILWSRTKIDFNRQVGDPMSNSIVVAVVGWIARNFPDAPVRVAKLLPDGIREYQAMSTTGAGFMLMLLERPNPWYSGVLMMNAVVVDFYCDGNGYIYKERHPQSAGTLLAGRVVRLWWLPSRYVEPRGDSETFITHYEYNPNGIIFQLDPGDVVHVRDGMDPQNPRKGRSKLKAVLREIYTDDEAANFTAQLLTNLGVPGVVLSPSNTNTGGIRSDPNTVKQAFMDKFSGDKRGEPLVLTAPTDVKVLSWSPDQLNLKDLRRVPEERISAALGVPASVANLGAGMDHNTLTNYPESRAAAYEEAIIPNHRLFDAELEIQLLPEFVNIDEGWDIDRDYSEVRALAAHRDATWKRLQSAATMGLITRATFKRGTNQKPTAEDEVYIAPNNYMIIDAGDGTVVAGGSKPPSGRLPAPANGNGRTSSAIEIPGTAMVAMAPQAIAEARCPECDKLLGYDVTGGRLWCSRCKLERAFGSAEVAA